jgi:hypothetical protein
VTQVLANLTHKMTDRRRFIAARNHHGTLAGPVHRRETSG